MEQQFITFSRQLKALFEPTLLLELARKCGFVKRLRVLHPAHLLSAIIQTMGGKDHANLADILRMIGASQICSHYKPFHNQIKKAEFTHFIQLLTEDTTKQLFLDNFKAELPEHSPFKHIHVHDGSSLTLNSRVKKTFPGRFTQTAPAAIELHLTLDLIKGVANYIGLDADKESEKHHRPFASELKETLVMMDAGYFDVEYCDEIARSKGYFLIRAKSNINPEVTEIYDEQGNLWRHSFSNLKMLKAKQDKLLDMSVKWEKYENTFRVIQFFDRKTRTKGYLMTNLAREQFNAKKVLSLYGLRWQVELFFKELKSYCSLKKCNTVDPNIIKSLIYCSILTLLINRYVTFSVSFAYRRILSTQKVCRSSTCWLPKCLTSIFGATLDLDGLRDVFNYIATHCRRSNLKRDKETELFRSELVPYFNINKLNTR